MTVQEKKVSKRPENKQTNKVKGKKKKPNKTNIPTSPTLDLNAVFVQLLVAINCRMDAWA